MQIQRKAAYVTAALVAFGTLASQALANQPNSGGTVGPTRGVISGTISFPENDLVKGFNSDACRDLRVVAEVPSSKQPKSRHGVLNLNPPRMTIEGKSGKLTGSLDGQTVECAYSIDDLTAGTFTVAAGGKVWGFKGEGGIEETFAPASQSVTLDRYGLSVAKKDGTDFVVERFLYGK